MTDILLWVFAPVVGLWFVSLLVERLRPYGYDRGKGLARSGLLGRIIMAVSQVPVIGDTFHRLRNLRIMSSVMAGGVHDLRSIPAALNREMYLVGNRRGHYRSFIRLLRNSASWERATPEYRRISVPVLVIGANGIGPPWTNANVTDT